MRIAYPGIKLNETNNNNNKMQLEVTTYTLAI